MKPEELYWSLLNRIDLRQITGLTYVQVRFILGLIPKEKLKDWLAWHEGLEKWSVLADLTVLSRPVGAQFVTSPPIPPVQPDEEIETTKTGSSLPRVDNRLNRRFLKQYAVEIVSREGKLFKTTTVNVSSNGMLLATKIPATFGRNFACKLTRADGGILNIFCAIIKESEDEERTRIRFTDVSQPKVLLSWLIDSKIK